MSSPRHWFLPETPDVLGKLRAQIAITIEGLEQFAAWAEGDRAAAERLDETERRGEVAKRELLVELRAAFVTPMEPEDVFTLSRSIDWVLTHARDVTLEARVMDVAPDARIAQMAGLMGDAIRHIDQALSHFGSDSDTAMQEADAAIVSEGALERAYYDGMAHLLSEANQRSRIGRRELYRRCRRIGEALVDVADRVVYAIVKQT